MADQRVMGLGVLSALRQINPLTPVQHRAMTPQIRSMLQRGRLTMEMIENIEELHRFAATAATETDVHIHLQQLAAAEVLSPRELKVELPRFRG